MLRLAILLSMTAALAAQTEKGQLTGTVLDATGAVVADAEILVTNAATGARRATQSTAEGFFAVPLLDPGEYSIEVKRAGFRAARRSGVPLRVNERLNVNFTLEVGALAESIEVTETVAAVDATTSDLGHVVERRQILDLPLNGRNTIALAALAAGVRPQATFGANPASVNYTGWGNFSANGGVANANEVLVDGVPVTHSQLGGVAYMPPVDGTQEFKVQTNNFSAEFDRTAGGVINMSMRSGTNQLHGSVYEFLRNNVFDANNFFLNRAGVARAPLRYNQFGATAGGPVIRDKTFFFGLYEGFRQREAPTLNGTVPTALQQAGDFSNTRTAAGALIRVHDPLTSRLLPDGRTWTRTQFPDNRIPASRVDPTAQKLARYIWPAPNNPGAPFTNLNNYIVTAPVQTDQDQFTLKLDHQVSAANRLSGSYSHSRFNLSGWDPLFNNTSVSQAYFPEKNQSHFLSIGDTHVVNPTTILELRAGFIRFAQRRLPRSFGQDLGQFGFPSSYQNAVQYRHIPVITVTGLTSLTNTTGSTILRATNNYSLSGSITKIRGLHNMKAGAQFRALQLNDVQLTFPSGSFGFNLGFTQENPLQPSATSGVGFASMLVGYPASGSVPKVDPLSTQVRYAGYYFQDDWRVTKRLTLNLGLRHSIEPFLTERFNRLSSFDFDARPQAAAAYSKLDLKGALTFAGPDRRSPADTSFGQWAPRFGFAFQVLPRTVLRGGYGFFWLPNNLATASSGVNNPAYSTGTAMVSSVDGGITPLTLISNPFPGGILSPPGNVGGAGTLIGQGVSGWLRETRPGNTQHWNFSLQQDLSRGFAIEAAYAASKSTHVPVTLQFNQLPGQLLSLGQGLLAQVANPFFGLVTTGGLSTRTVSAGQLLRPFPQFTGVTAAGAAPIGNLTYHSLQIKATKRFGQGAMVTLAYTFAKNLGDVESRTEWLEPSGPAVGFMDNNNRRLDKSYSSFDLPHRAVLHFNYELPFGKQRKLPGVWNQLIAGWQVNGLATMQSGYPLTFGTAQNVTNSFGGGSRPNLVGNPAVPGTAHERLNRWFDPAAFAQPAAFTFGNAPRTFAMVRSHGTANLDFSLFKNVRFLERYTLQFRAESFNVMNRVRFGMPNDTFGAPGFGVVAAQGNDPRQIQLALKLLF